MKKDQRWNQLRLAAIGQHVEREDDLLVAFVAERSHERLDSGLIERRHRVEDLQRALLDHGAEEREVARPDADREPEPDRPADRDGQHEVARVHCGRHGEEREGRDRLPGALRDDVEERLHPPADRLRDRNEEELGRRALKRVAKGAVDAAEADGDERVRHGDAREGTDREHAAGSKRSDTRGADRGEDARNEENLDDAAQTAFDARRDRRDDRPDLAAAPKCRTRARLKE